MTTIHIMAVALDIVMSGVFAFFGAVSWRIHEGPIRTRIVTACTIVVVDLAGAAALRLVTGDPVPIWYVPVYGMVAPAAAYAGVLHISTTRARMRVLRNRIQLFDDELERRRRQQAAAALVRSRQP